MLRQLQSAQYAHDQRNHFDILSLHKTERLKHYGLHFAKYAGRLARGSAEPKPVHRTITDAFLINLSAANTLAQDLSLETFAPHRSSSKGGFLVVFADAAGRFADACEKLDHLEESIGIAKTANRDITSWLLWAADEYRLDLERLIADRRNELAARLFYIAD
jgi:hypothetical protein